MKKDGNDANLDNEVDSLNDTDDLSYEPDAAGEKLEWLKKQLEVCKQERQEYLDGWQRMKAEAINSRREQQMLADRVALRGREEVLRELLAVIDSFDMARKSSQWNSVDENWRSGMEQVYTQVEGVFAQFGATRFGAVGEPFDPEVHEAVGVDSNEGADAVITEVVRSGWRINDTILRPAQVRISQ